jgi:hypothetical protein
VRTRIALVAALAVTVGLGLYAARPTAEPTAVLATPVTATPTTTQTQSATPTTTTQDVVLSARATAVPPDFRYVEAWPGRIVMLELAARRARELATYTASSSEPGYPGAQLSASADGRTLLILVRVSATDGTLFVLKPESGEVRRIMRGPVERALLSLDGARFAVTRHDPDPLLTGLWLGATADATMHRLIADDPQLVGSPPIPLAFSFDGQLLAFGLGMGDTGYRGGVTPVATAEVDARRLRDPGATTPGVTLLDFASGAEFISPTELFVWSSRSAFGGQTGAYAYDIASKRKGGPVSANRRHSVGSGVAARQRSVCDARAAELLRRKPSPDTLGPRSRRLGEEATRSRVLHRRYVVVSRRNEALCHDGRG